VPARRSRNVSGDSSDSDSDSDDQICAFLGAVGISPDQLGAPLEEPEDAPVRYAAAAHDFVMAEGDEVMVPADTEDARDARAQLRGVVDGLISERLEELDRLDPPTAPAGGGAQPRTRASPHVLTPDGKLVSIQQLVAQCNHLQVGEKPSKDRLTRVMSVDTSAIGNSSQRTYVQVSGA
jgi:hypothetical protein